MVVGDGRPAAVVVALDEESIVLVRQFRRSVGADTWELPRGSSDVEDAVDAATGERVDVYGDAALIRAGLRELLSVDSTVVRAHQHAAGARRDSADTGGWIE